VAGRLAQRDYRALRALVLSGSRPEFSRGEVAALVGEVYVAAREFQRRIDHMRLAVLLALDRAHTGRLTRGRIPHDIVYRTRKMKVAQ
jgi:hypothetical protein